jgi:hypothetical protein
LTRKHALQTTGALLVVSALAVQLAGLASTVVGDTNLPNDSPLWWGSLLSTCAVICMIQIGVASKVDASVFVRLSLASICIVHISLSLGIHYVVLDILNNQT